MDVVFSIVLNRYSGRSEMYSGRVNEISFAGQCISEALGNTRALWFKDQATVSSSL